MDMTLQQFYEAGLAGPLSGPGPSNANRQRLDPNGPRSKGQENFLNDMGVLPKEWPQTYSEASAVIDSKMAWLKEVSADQMPKNKQEAVAFISNSINKLKGITPAQKELILKLNPNINVDVLNRLTRHQAGVMIDSYTAKKRQSAPGSCKGWNPHKRDQADGDDDARDGSDGSGARRFGSGGGAYGGAYGGASGASGADAGNTPAAGGAKAHGYSDEKIRELGVGPLRDRKTLAFMTPDQKKARVKDYDRERAALRRRNERYDVIYKEEYEKLKTEFKDKIDHEGRISKDEEGVAPKEGGAAGAAAAAAAEPAVAAARGAEARGGAATAKPVAAAVAGADARARTAPVAAGTWKVPRDGVAASKSAAAAAEPAAAAYIPAAAAAANPEAAAAKPAYNCLKKRPIEDVDGIPTPDPRRPGQRRQQDLHESPASNGLAAGAPAEAMNATNAPGDVTLANGGTAAAVPDVGAAAVKIESVGPAAASRGPAAASREPPPARAAQAPVAAQAAAARDGLVHEEGGAAMAGGAPEQQAPDGGRSSGHLEPSLEEAIEMSLADAFVCENDAAGGAAAGTADEEMLRFCGMLDDELTGIAATIALLDPRMLQSLAAAKAKAVDSAKGSREAAAAAEAEAAAVAEKVAAARKELGAEYEAAGQACLAAKQQLASAGAFAAFDVATSKAARRALEVAEAVLLTCMAGCAKAEDRARQAGEKAEADQVAASRAETSYLDVAEAAVKMGERLGGGSGSGSGGGEEIVRQLPDLVKWAVDFMGRLSPERRLAAVRAAAAAAREGGSNEEQELRLFARLPRLQERSHENKDRLAFRLAQQITNRYLRVGGRRAV
ncbi:hypothetical protein PLESTB_000272300 [Pleodorina starrii]|uniref:Uncharacterized protein n=1 Tax=Pleodorina starrii TaxID=330485 RepID=A0A9W6BDI6_9CHLO|nr:hypothetical protein PLESTB_000272300 [Pleodorina starrii]